MGCLKRACTCVGLTTAGEGMDNFKADPVPVIVISTGEDRTVVPTPTEDDPAKSRSRSGDRVSLVHHLVHQGLFRGSVMTSERVTVGQEHTLWPR